MKNLQKNFSIYPALHIISMQGWELALFGPNCENVAVFRIDLAANILFGLEYLLKFGLFYMWYHILEFKHLKCHHVHSHKDDFLLTVKITQFNIPIPGNGNSYIRMMIIVCHHQYGLSLACDDEYGSAYNPPTMFWMLVFQLQWLTSTLFSCKWVFPIKYLLC